MTEIDRAIVAHKFSPEVMASDARLAEEARPIFEAMRRKKMEYMCDESYDLDNLPDYPMNAADCEIVRKWMFAFMSPEYWMEPLRMIGMNIKEVD